VKLVAGKYVLDWHIWKKNGNIGLRDIGTHTKQIKRTTLKL